MLAYGFQEMRESCSKITPLSHNTWMCFKK